MPFIGFSFTRPWKEAYSDCCLISFEGVRNWDRSIGRASNRKIPLCHPCQIFLITKGRFLLLLTFGSFLCPESKSFIPDLKEFLLLILTLLWYSHTSYIGIISHSYTADAIVGNCCHFSSAPRTMARKRKKRLSNKTLLVGLRMSLLVWISKPVVSRIMRRKPRRCRYSTVCAFLCLCRGFKPSLCRLSPFLLSNVKRPWRLLGIYPDRASGVSWKLLHILCFFARKQ